MIEGGSKAPDLVERRLLVTAWDSRDAIAQECARLRELLQQHGIDPQGVTQALKPSQVCDKVKVTAEIPSVQPNEMAEEPVPYGHHEYLYDVKLYASLRVVAESRYTAWLKLHALLDCATANFGADDNGNPILGEVSLDLDSGKLIEVDGEAI